PSITFGYWAMNARERTWCHNVCTQGAAFTAAPAGDWRRRRRCATLTCGPVSVPVFSGREQMPQWIDNIVVRVKDLASSLKDYETKLGMKASKGPEDQPHLGLRRAVLPIGDEGRFIELAEPLGEG